MTKENVNEVAPEQEPEEAPSPENTAASAEEDAMTALQKDLEKFRDLALRSQADLDNYRKRMTRDREEAVRFANFSLIEQLLPVIDSFELGLDAARQTKEGEGFVTGFEMVLRQLMEFLRSQNVEVVDALGAEFDPNLHDAVAQEESDEAPEGTVIRQIRKGYKLRERLVRPATVVVSKGSPKRDE